MGELTDDFATTKVSEDSFVGGGRLAMINGVIVFGLPVLVGGSQIGGAVGIGTSIVAFILGGIILAIVGTATGIIGVRNRLTSYMMNNFVFGRHASLIFNIVMSVSVLGWYGVSMDIFSATLQKLTIEVFDYAPTIWLIEVLAGVLMTFTAIWGFALLQRLAFVVTPLLMIVIAYLGVKGFSAWDFNMETTVGDLATISLGEAVTATTGGFIVSAVLMSDFTRFAKRDSDTVIASFLPFFVFATIGYLISAVAAVSLQTNDLLEILVGHGLGSTALWLIFLSSWIANVINLYSCSLSLASVFTQLSKWHLVVVAGCIGTVAALANILDQFVGFLIVLSICLAPIGGIYIVDFFFLRKQEVYELDNLSQLPAFRFRALASWGLSVCISFLLGFYDLTVSGFQVVDALGAAMLIYILLSWRLLAFPDSDGGLGS